MTQASALAHSASLADLALYRAKQSGHNAWVGLFSTPKTNATNLISATPQSIETFIEREELQVQSSPVLPHAR